MGLVYPQSMTLGLIRGVNIGFAIQPRAGYSVEAIV
jgi:hypothetical protein